MYIFLGHYRWPWGVPSIDRDAGKCLSHIDGCKSGPFSTISNQTSLCSTRYKQLSVIDHSLRQLPVRVLMGTACGLTDMPVL